MRNISSFVLCLAFLSVTCKENSTQSGQSLVYNQMLFERVGGGNLVFVVTPVNNQDTFNVMITKKEYRDTSIQRVITRDNSSASVLDTLTEALNGKYVLTGNYVRDTTAIVGTWSIVYLTKDSNKIEITNSTLRNTLLQIESFVRSTL